MKAEKEKAKKESGSGFSKMAAAFATGAAAGLAVGVLISSDRGAKLRDKVKGLVREFGGEWEDNHSHSPNQGQNQSQAPGYDTGHNEPDNAM